MLTSKVASLSGAVLILAVLIVCSLTVLTSCGPIPVAIDTGKVEDHQVDMLNEVHHDVKDVQNQDLAIDALPDESNDAAGDRQLSNEEQQQQQPQQPAEIAAPEAANDNAARIDQNKLDAEQLKLGFAKNAEKIPLDKLIPVDHMDVVKMEQDGHVNKDYHKEMFLGGQHVEFMTEPVDHAEGRLKDIVEKADLNQDGSLSKSEMEMWILQKMKEHFEEAKHENEEIFHHLDPDGDGFITWKEYYIHFLLSRDFDVEDALKHVMDYDESIKLDQEDKDNLVSYKFRWTDADRNPTDNKLSKDEFMVFRHPEHSKKSLELMVNNVMEGVDSNKNGFIEMDEFAALPPGEVEGKEFEEMDRKWQEERKTEFRDMMDENQDGKVNKEELHRYLDPTNPVQAKLEADSLMSLMDDNRDNLLSMKEILAHSDIFISSKLVNFAANVHDEF